jgi:rod shape-determining protein MreC
VAAARGRTRGFSRRVQLSLFIGYVSAIIGIVIALGLVAIQHFDPARFAILRGLAADVAGGVGMAGRTLINPVTKAGSAVADYWQAGSQNRALREQLAATQTQAITARLTTQENNRLRATLKLIERNPEQIAVARIVGAGPSGNHRFATITAGASDGVAAGQPVVAAEGLIGRVVLTGIMASRVMLLTDGESVVPVRISRSGQPAIAYGAGDGRIRLRLAIGAVGMQRGDIVVTSGAGGLFAPNLPVAVILAADGEYGIGLPLADPARVDTVAIYPPYRPPLPDPVPATATQ